MTAPNRTLLWATVLLDELARLGVRMLSVAPGSRSSPLVLAAVADGRCRLVTHYDERSAAFFALGASRALRRPAAVITTSGTAVANLFPAVIEASQSDIPLLVLSADRPATLRGTDANQTIDQIRLFGTYPRAFFDAPVPERVSEDALRRVRGLAARAVAASFGPPGGPVHLNVSLPKPLEPTLVPGDLDPEMRERHPLAMEGRDEGAPYTQPLLSRIATDQAVTGVLEHLPATGRGVIVAGPLADPLGAGPALRALAHATGYPLLADPLSGARFAPGPPDGVLAAYDAFLREETLWPALAPDLILRFGATPTSAAVQEFLERHAGVCQIVVDAGSRWTDAAGSAAVMIRADPAAVVGELAVRVAPARDTAWLDRWRRPERVAREALERALASGGFEPLAVVEAVRAAARHGRALFVGNSMPIRDLDRFAGCCGTPVPLHANRGASGIDGLVSTALGVGAALGRSPVAVLGDLSFLHDLNGLFAARESGVGAVFVVVNNDGGGIFHHLPIRDHEPAFTRHVVVPHGRDLSRAAALFDIPHCRPELDGGLGGVLDEAVEGGGTRIVEVRTDRTITQRRHAETLAAVRAAVAAARGAKA